MASAWKIQVGVELDTSDIQTQLNNVSKNIKINADTSDAQQSIQDLTLTYQAANEIFSKTVAIISDMVGQYAELDRATTEFKKVSDLSGTSLDKYVQKLGKMGQTTARSSSEMVEAATEFRKNSFNDEDSAQLALVATAFQNVSDTSISAADSAGFIISQLKAFQSEGITAYQVIDKVNEV